MDTDNNGMVTLCRKIRFSSGHRYYQPAISEEENRRIYGSSYSEHGHGHNFLLEAYLEGTIDPTTGMVINLKEVDQILKQVVDPLDHHHLNFDVPYFESKVPTTENIARYCFFEMQRKLPAERVRLKKVRLYEGDDLWVDYTGGGS